MKLQVSNNDNTNNNTNTNDNVYGAVISHFESSPCSSDVRRPAPDGRRPSDQANRPGLGVRL